MENEAAIALLQKKVSALKAAEANRHKDERARLLVGVPRALAASLHEAPIAVVRQAAAGLVQQEMLKADRERTDRRAAIVRRMGGGWAAPTGIITERSAGGLRTTFSVIPLDDKEVR